MLFRATVAVYCENHTEHKYTLWAENSVRTSQETRLRYKDQPVNAVQGNSRCLLWEPYGTHKYILCAEWGLLICWWYIKKPLGLKWLTSKLLGKFLRKWIRPNITKLWNIESKVTEIFRKVYSPSLFLGQHRNLIQIIYRTFTVLVWTTMRLRSNRRILKPFTEQ
jgi:hypothetical protein